MPDLYDLPLKVLWIFNCNEAEMAVDFLLEDGGKYFQVKGSGIDAFTSDGQFKVCATDNLDRNYIHKPSAIVYIKESALQKKVLNYWKKKVEKLDIMKC